ncbi:hypothetical protein L6164_033826 [Bauhinia variegata]|uniref:Uncharacterized protein n=1 Tax=Bauhinia variegata TaxID=167791 RepID=A0ACB9KTP8_BAUVA|nr:hypothetical protein L6164_033826 [Bauhinia variegata]
MEYSHTKLVSFLLLFLILFLSSGAEARRQPNFRPTKLFVFGDSYVDTGNTMKVDSSAWKDPYGESFPGQPAGRFSDGRVLTDYIAKYLGVKSPVPYQLRESKPEHVKYGMNFAFGGTGVFNTSSQYPNMTIQIDFFEQLIKNNVYTKTDLTPSVALVSVAGNDYSYYLLTNGSAEGFPSFLASVVNQTKINLIRIYELGVKKIIVDGLQPLGCLPEVTLTSSFQQCNSTFNALVGIHNSLLNEAVAQLNQQAKDNSTFIVLDLYDSFMSVLNHTSSTSGHKLKPCCVGLSSEFSCGFVDDDNVKQYDVCDVPKSSFFWDLVHPTQAGWHAVYNKLRKTTALKQLY